MQASESALWVISMVLHKVSNFTKTAVTDVNLQGTHVRGEFAIISVAVFSACLRVRSNDPKNMFRAGKPDVFMF